MRNDELPIDYEKETPGPTGYYRNIVTYPQIVRHWDNETLRMEMDTLDEHLRTQPRNGNNSVRIELMERAEKMMQKEWEGRQE